MSVFFNSDGSFPLQFMIIFAVIFVVLAAIVLVFRRLSGKGMSLSSKTGPRGRQPRLGIVDIYELDRQRQLILLRRDNVEHLLLVGGPNDVIVERNINRGAGVRMPLEEAPRVEPASEDPIFEPARPADPAAAGAPPFQPKTFEPPKTFEQPAFEQPVFEAPERKAPPATVSAAPVAVEEAAPQRDLPAEPKPNGRPSRAEVIAARAARRNPPPLANLKADVPDRQRPPSGGRAAGDVEPTFDSGEIATPVAPREETPPPAAERARERTPQSPAPVPPAPVLEPAPPVLPPVPPPIARPTSSRPVDAAILSDMARQLEEALRRPSAAVSPSSQAGAPVQPNVPSPPPPEPRPQAEPKRDVAPAPAKAPAESAIDPMAAAMAARPEEPTAPVPEPKPFLPPPPPPAPEPEAPAPRRAAGPSQNPFSVEEIEAEFARLLGRPLDKKN